MKSERKVKVEVCLDSVESAVRAQVGGADRVELCDNLFEGGTTPSAGSIRVTRRSIDIGLQVIIRPRGGDFLYSPREFEVMREDVIMAREEGADGVVLGILTARGEVDQERNAELLELARPMNVTFHRAFDMVQDPFAALETIISLGFDRILSSGQEASVLEGASRLRDLVKRAGDRIIIMPGAGITPRNIGLLAGMIGAREYHIAANRDEESAMTYRPGHVFMGGQLRQPEFVSTFTDESQVSDICRTLE
ncbi:copper homeostasis protein [Alkalispirochaeta americana]|uniref:PF03932 family protein CutC n=1 Tax=Alkalispirochaeta americana TaxID=159291 RepID=A0A1N6RJ69_9SPIO|nr:copper homeostasis protein CutC [Alkalispirochaeta americana]SIQ28883.1 copper homeostasis protein [Alkalispirochaeta americana]